MRTKEQIDFLKTKQSPAEQYLNFLSINEVGKLVQIYQDSPNKLKKETGPTVLNVTKIPELDPIVAKLKKRWGNFDVRYANIFEVETPHVIHNDDEKTLPNAYKAFTIPLYVEGGSDFSAKLIMFNQYYYGGPAKFFNGYKDKLPMHYNKNLTDYTDVENLVDEDINEAYYRENLTHLQKDWLKGLSLDRQYPWFIGSCIAFDSLQLHCASDFTKKGITKKIGLSIFTTIEE